MAMNNAEHYGFRAQKSQAKPSFFVV